MSKCLAVPRTALEETKIWEGLERKRAGEISVAVFLDAEQVTALFKVIKENGEFLERKGSDGVETKPEWQQVIFYGFVTKDRKEFFVYKRGGGGSGSQEERLHSRLSAGVGGHIEPFDTDLITSLYREINEELLFEVGGRQVEFSDDIAKVSVVGLIKDEAEDVGKVHLGLVCLVELENLDLQVKLSGDENVEGWFTDMTRYQELLDSGNYTPESWTTLLLEKLAPQLLSSA